MNYLRFAAYNVIGGILWVMICVLAGYQFGGLEFVKKRFELIIVAIVVISILPMAIEYLRARRSAKREQSAPIAATTLGEDSNAA